MCHKDQSGLTANDYARAEERERRTVNVKEPTLFGYPVQLSVKITKTQTVDLTHALRWDGKGTITLDQKVVVEAINGARARGLGLPQPPR